ncbi:programmed cell death protein 5 [Candida albicans P76067]|nr:programmed cell death protein 5 [Candida albicans P34048]KGU21113.1 programmed cell death protein 5 [Candida albicans P57055]KHC28453.1 programmed cell death protein 5 [Candida albicans P76067]
MDDAELNAIRQARLAELQRNAAGGGSSTNPSSSSSGGAQDSAQENMTITILNRILTNEARERLSRVKIVRPDRAQAVENYIIKLYSMGQIHQKLGEKDIVQILDGLSRDSQQKQQTKITFNRKNIADDDEDDFFD